MTALEIKNQVTSKHQEGQEITLWIPQGEKGAATPIKIKIIKFNPNSVLVERKGYKESYSYWEMKTMSSKPIAKSKDVIIPDKIRSEGRHKYNPVVAIY